MFYYTIFLRHNAVVYGIPVTLMVTISESQSSLRRWLFGLKIGLKLSNSPTFMIDYSAID